jgi:hypothetical protein
MKTGDSESDPGSAPTPTPDSLPRIGSDGYQVGSDQRVPESEVTAGRDGYQSGDDEPSREGDVAPGDSSGSQTASGEPPTLERAPDPASPPRDDREKEGGGIDPYEAFARAASDSARKRRRENERRDPAIWLPGSDDLDQELGRPDSETRFSRDSWRRGNPQVSVRLRPMDFDRLRRAADLYGVRPTTLARMMVIRGVRAIHDAELRKEADQFREGPDY